MEALSRLVPNPPTTFHRRRLDGYYLHYLDLWLEWWEENRHDYESGQTTLPPRPADSILNLSEGARDRLEDAVRERSYEVARLYNLAWQHDGALTYDEWQVRYIAGRQAERVAARVAARVSAEESEGSSRWLWLLIFCGILVAPVVVVAVVRISTPGGSLKLR